LTEPQENLEKKSSRLNYYEKIQTYITGRTALDRLDSFGECMSMCNNVVSVIAAQRAVDNFLNT
jgi:hypothetical protein